LRGKENARLTRKCTGCVLNFKFPQLPLFAIDREVLVQRSRRHSVLCCGDMTTVKSMSLADLCIL
jgi:hypothetical protein